jgi:hypothetical protein
MRRFALPPSPLPRRASPRAMFRRFESRVDWRVWQMSRRVSLRWTPWLGEHAWGAILSTRTTSGTESACLTHGKPARAGPSPHGCRSERAAVVRCSGSHAALRGRSTGRRRMSRMAAAARGRGCLTARGEVCARRGHRACACRRLGVRGWYRATLRTCKGSAEALAAPSDGGGG